MKLLSILLFFYSVIPALLFSNGAWAEVSVESSAHATAASYNGASPTSVFISDQVGYVFYRHSTGIISYRKTSDGGASWSSGGATIVDPQTDAQGVAVWYDQWTPGDESGTLIHILTWDNGNDDLFYQYLDTSTDTLSAQVNASSTGQGGTFGAGSTQGSITKATSGEVYIGIFSTTDSFVLTCSASCTSSSSSWAEAGDNSTASIFDFAADWLILLPLAGGDIMAVRWDISADDVQSKIYSSSAWAGSWTNIDTAAPENLTYDAAFGAVVDKSTNRIYLAYGTNIGTGSYASNNDDIRTSLYNGGSWTPKTDVFTNSSTRFVTDVKIAFDDNTGDVYVAYAARTTATDANTANIYYSSSTDGMATWSSESAAVNTDDDEIYGAHMNILSDERIYITWYAATPDDLFGSTIADLSPPTVSFDLASSLVTEAGATVALTVNLSDSSLHDVTVDYAVSGGTATEGDDYVLASGTLTIPAGDASGSIPLVLNGDSMDEEDETIEVEITNPTHASLGSEATHTLTVTDDDTAGFTVTPITGLTTTEAGGAASFTVVLNTEPTDAVSLSLSSSDSNEGNASPSFLTFTDADWNAPQTVTVMGVDDAIDDGDLPYSIVTSPATSADTHYNGLDASDVSFTNTDDEAPPVLSILDAAADENDGVTTVTVSLTGASSSIVTVNYATANQTALDGSDYTAASGTLTWAAEETGIKTFTVTLLDNLRDEEDDETAALTLSSPANATIADGDGMLTISDDDPEPTVFFFPESGSTAETAASAAVSVVLSAASDKTVMVAYEVSGGTAENAVDYDFTAGTLTFSPGDTSASFSFTILSDDVHEESESISFVLSSPNNASLGSASRHEHAIADNDDAGVAITESGSQTLATEGETAIDTYTVVLTSRPTDSVTVTLSPDANVAVDRVSLDFDETNWNIVQTIDVSAVDDAVSEGNHTGTIFHSSESAGDPFYDGLAIDDISVSITDNDSAGASLVESSGSTEAAEGGLTDSYTFVLTSQPTEEVVITAIPDDQSLVSPDELTFTPDNWNVAQVFTVSAVNDDVVEGGHSSLVTHSISSTDSFYDVLSLSDVTVSVIDDDSAGVTISPSGGTTDVSEGGSQDDYTVVLTSQPSGSVTVSVTTDAQLTVDPASLIFTTSNWDDPQSVTVGAVDDTDIEGTHAGTLSHEAVSSDSNYSGLSVSSLSVAIADNDAEGEDENPSENETTVNANAGEDQTVSAGFEVVLDGRDSTGEGLSYVWSINPASTSQATLDGDTDELTALLIDFDAAVGDIIVDLTVTDATDASDSDQVIIHVAQSSPSTGVDEDGEDDTPAGEAKGSGSFSGGCALRRDGL